MLSRRRFLQGMLGSTAVLASSGCRYWPSEGFSNPCLGRMPKELAEHELVQAAWEGIDPAKVWDCHAHLIGVGDSDSGIHVNENMRSLWHPIQYTQFNFYMNASCAMNGGNTKVDAGVVRQYLKLHREMPKGFKFMLLAFDYAHDDKGRPMKESAFYTPNDYAIRMVRRYPEAFEWIASIHPYRLDALEELELAIANGARAVKWLPGAMVIDARDKRCEPFYEILVKHDIPLLTHAGVEHAVEVPGGQGYNNPQTFDRALELGVKVIFAHCATLGEYENAAGEEVASLDLFRDLVKHPDYKGRAYGDISAILQINRSRESVEKIYTDEDLHPYLIYGSDYPLPGVMPLFRTQNFVNWGYLKESEAQVLERIREHNCVLYDFVLKRSLVVKGKRLPASVYHSRDLFA